MCSPFCAARTPQQPPAPQVTSEAAVIESCKPIFWVDTFTGTRRTTPTIPELKGWRAKYEQEKTGILPRLLKVTGGAHSLGGNLKGPCLCLKCRRREICLKCRIMYFRIQKQTNKKPGHRRKMHADACSCCNNHPRDTRTGARVFCLTILGLLYDHLSGIFILLALVK